MLFERIESPLERISYWELCKLPPSLRPCFHRIFYFVISTDTDCAVSCRQLQRWHSAEHHVYSMYRTRICDLNCFMLPTEVCTHTIKAVVPDCLCKQGPSVIACVVNVKVQLSS